MKPLRSRAVEQKTLSSPLRMMKPLRSRAVEQKTPSSPLRMMKPLRSRAVEQKTLSSPLRMAGRQSQPTFASAGEPKPTFSVWF
jgi:hypothetical protein